ncbi:MAG: tRNA (adenosine(37)-N6)-dimethylallyltransferase MiaA [Deltaproteobacteria bacterium]|nr:tRNA (adenosine(37)-N6)-dimethylallyltransferase MiaA [Deltaproteobacteria bacterium]
MTLPKIIVIAGPTGVGKSSLAVELAQELNGEIISADSVQIYRYMDIGTAKPSLIEREKVPHHMVDIINPDADFSAADFGKQAEDIITDITARGKVPFIVGGTGLYIKALTKGLFTGPGRDDAIRERLINEAREFGREALHKRLMAIDPVSAEKIHPNNIARVVRAIEVFEVSGKPISELHKEHAKNSVGVDEKNKRYNCLNIALNIERAELYSKIDKRVDDMMEQGLVAEVRGLLKRGYGSHLNSMHSLGYKEIISHIEGGVSLESAVVELKKNTRHYAKRQLTWFRGDKSFKWFAPADKIDIIKVIRDRLVL